MHNLGSCIPQEAVNAAARCQPKTVSCVNSKAILVQADNKAGPLLRPDGDCSICFFDITHSCL